ncbi:hypothetical protein Dsin_005133 [Dipteronia sinensis]|uniref:Uncharacterized protein n=1 Tax=Dipteronia sinensis TaxID=43782 RepID=A0AAE0AVX9_9ROSI|nr:hypothetical protein Dsin_005133 [Dipteronia sinensis]
MVRELKEVLMSSVNGDGFGGVCVVLWIALLTLSLISTIIFSCAGGASKDKTSSADSNTYYGGGCGAGCGAGCGGGCGA